MTPRTDLSYRPLQSRLHQILDASDLTECALSEVHISALAHHPDEHYLPTLKRLLKIWAELQTRLGHDNTSALRREIANKIAKSLKADHLTRAVTAYVEYAPRATTADLDTITVLVQNLMEPGEADMAELEHGDLPPNPYYLNPVVLTRVSFMIYQGVKAAKTVGGSPNKGRSLADPVTPVGPMSRESFPPCLAQHSCMLILFILDRIRTQHVSG